MKIEYHYIPTMTIEQFAEKHDLTMAIFERKGGHPSVRFYAHFKNAEVKDGSVLIGEHGNGPTEGEAIADYARKISGKRLVLNAYDEKRLEIDVPGLDR